MAIDPFMSRRYPRDEFQLRYGVGASLEAATSEIPLEPTSFLVQFWEVERDAAGRFVTKAVYRSRVAAFTAAERCDLDQGGDSHFRVVTLLDLVREGGTAVVEAMIDLMSSPHQWTLSLELGAAGKFEMLEMQSVLTRLSELEVPRQNPFRDGEPG